MHESSFIDEAEVVGKNWMLDDARVNTVGYIPRRHGASSLLSNLMKGKESEFRFKPFPEQGYEVIVHKKTGTYFSVLTPNASVCKLLEDARKIEFTCACST